MKPKVLLSLTSCRSSKRLPTNFKTAQKEPGLLMDTAKKLDVSLRRRVSEFPGEHLVADCGKL